MSDESQQEVAPETATEGTDTSTNVESGKADSPSPDVAELQRKVQDLNRALSEERKKNKPLQPETAPSKAETAPPPGVTKTDVIGTAKEYAKLISKGYSDEELSYIEEYAKGAGVSVSAAADNPFVKSGIEAARKATEATEATPPASPKVATPVERMREIAQMDKADRAKSLSFDAWRTRKIQEGQG